MIKKSNNAKKKPAARTGKSKGPKTKHASASRKATATKRKAPKKAPKTARSKKRKAKKDFVPNIVVFACNWCSYAGADNAGVNRVQYSPNFRVIRTMCSGRVTPAFVLKAFKLGADGVMVSGCHFGDCHYIFGNYKAVEQFEKTKALVKTLGLDEKRIALEWVSAAEGTRWGEVIDLFVAQVTELGPSPLNHRKKTAK
ncbi:MAG: hydrogenase iron-sulfur subunit [Candidatus Hydrogenedentota bacterium]|nr:MAG: hydrogenase iron-sulfur subunit [Candidatus Hydrogenedentota bacterium]